MSKQAGSKLKNARPVASVQASAVNEISLLERVSILASILLSLKQSTGGAAAAEGFAAETLAGEATTGDIGAPEGVAKAFQPLEIARLPETVRTEDQHETRPGSAGVGEHRLAAESNTDPLQPIAPAQADAALKPIARGSSTSPALLKIEVVDDEAGSPLSLEKLVPATPVSDIIISSVPATTFLFTGPAGPNNFDIFVGTGQGPNTVDFSGLEGLAAATNQVQGEGGVVIRQDASAPNGVFVDLTATAATVETAVGPVTVQAWQLDGSGKAVMPLAHLENIDHVTGTVGNDVVIGNANANTFTYTAADGTHDGQSASYGFDVYYGGPSGAANDPGDTVDFSRLGTQESVAAAPASRQALLPHDAKGITLDLAQAVTIAMVDPVTGETTGVTGSLVSTIGGAEQTDLALLAWSAPAEGGAAQATIEEIVGTGGADVVFGDAAANAYVAVGGGENGVSVFDGRAGTDTVDFSKVAASSTEAQATAAAGEPAAAVSDVVVPDGVYVNLSANEHTAESSNGEVTVQAWSLGPDGAAGTALAHLENVETVVGTVGNDILVGNIEANTFVYTAADDATIDAAGQIAAGPDANYGFDIYVGGNPASSSAADAHDTADFSTLGSQESVAAALAEGITSVLLPNGATGIVVDLAQAVSITTIDPETGDATTVTGSLVTTLGGSQETDLALLAWTAPPDGSEAHSSIENIVTSGGCDAILGDSADNTVIVSGNGENGPIYFDGRGSTDTIDFGQLELTGTTTGIEIHLNQSNDGVTDPTGAQQSDVTQVSLLGAPGSAPEDAVVAQVKDVENVVGSCGNDVIEGDRNDNVLSGGGGSDSFVFADVAVVDGRGVTQIGHDIIRDFRSGGIDDDDHLVFDSQIFNFHDGSSLDWLQQLLNNNQIRDEDEGLIIWIDENNSITLQNYELDDYSGHGLGLAAYSSWIVFV